jgi:hypothetical protein
VLAALPGDELRKVRHRLGGPLVLDVFEAPLHGLLLAEAEFATIEQARAFVPPPICHAEVSADERFTGAALARAARADVVAWAAGYGVAIYGLVAMTNTATTTSSAATTTTRATWLNSAA